MVTFIDIKICSKFTNDFKKRISLIWVYFAVSISFDYNACKPYWRGQ